MGIGTYIAGGLNTLTLGAVGNRPAEVHTYVVHQNGSVEEDAYLLAARESSSQQTQATVGAVGIAGGAIAGGMFAQSRLAMLATRLAGAGGSTAGVTAARWAVGILQGGVGLMGVLGAGGAMLAQTGGSIPGTGWLSDMVSSDQVVHQFYDDNGALLGERTYTRDEVNRINESPDLIDLNFEEPAAQDTAG